MGGYNRISLFSKIVYEISEKVKNLFPPKRAGIYHNKL